MEQLFSTKISQFFKTVVLTMGLNILTMTLVKHWIQLLQKSALFTVQERTCSRFTRLFVRSFVVCLSPCPKYLINPYNAIFLKSQGSKDIKNDILDCQIHKYTNTNSQIHKYSLWWSAGNTQHVLYFWKDKGPRTSNIIFWTVKYTYIQIQMHKYTNTNS